jgi:hypothetical protein
MTFVFQGVFYLSGELTHEIKNEQIRKRDLNYICALTTITLLLAGVCCKYKYDFRRNPRAIEELSAYPSV